VPETVLVVRSATPFAADGSLDEDALRAYLQRFVDQRIGLSLASGGSGEGHALTPAEIRRIYEIGVELGRGKVIVHSNQPQEHTALASIEQAKIAVAAGVDAVSIYGPGGFHGYKSTDEEYLRYFDRVLTEIRHPVALNPNPIVGYAPSSAVIAEITNKYPQVAAIYLSGISDDAYTMDLRDRITRPDVGIWVTSTGSFHTLGLGADGIIASANFIPKTYRQYADLYDAGKFGELDPVYEQLRRVAKFCEPWKFSSPRTHKMIMKVFKLPGGGGGVREPHLDHSPESVARFTEGALRLPVPEIQEMARTAGLVT
jgi:dihydrodipicolinate synthase/N-acetylneuraminate lyase